MSHQTTIRILDLAAAAGVIGFVQDLYILAIPIQLVAGLRLQKKKKLGVIALFFTGFLASICSIINAALRIVERTKTVPDSLWESIPIYTTSIIELNVGIICGCIPVIVVLFKDLAHSHYVTSIKRLIRSRYGSRYASDRSDSGSDSGSDLHKAEKELPEVPTGTLSGLKSFVRKFDKSQSRSQPEETVMRSNFDTLASTDESYHEVLKANR